MLRYMFLIFDTCIFFNPRRQHTVPLFYTRESWYPDLLKMYSTFTLTIALKVLKAQILSNSSTIVWLEILTEVPSLYLAYYTPIRLPI